MNIALSADKVLIMKTRSYAKMLVSALAISLLLTACDEEENTVSMQVDNAIMSRESTLCISDYDSEAKEKKTKPISDERMLELEKKLEVEPASVDKSSGMTTFKRKISGVNNNEYDGKICFYEFVSQFGSITCYFERVLGKDDLATDLEADFKAAEHACFLLSEWVVYVAMADADNRDSEKVRQFIGGTLLLGMKNFMLYRYAYPKEEERGIRFAMYMIERLNLDLQKIEEIKKEITERTAADDLGRVEKEKTDKDPFRFFLLVTSILAEYGLGDSPEISTFLKAHPMEARSAEFAKFVMVQDKSGIKS